MNRAKFVVLLSYLFGVASSSPTVDVTRRILNFNPDSDIFSNPSCKSADCPSNSGCFDGPCCKCKCTYSFPNFLVKDWTCKSNVDTERITNSNCAFSIRPDNEPLEVLDLTEQSSGKHKFTSSSVRVNCNNDVIVKEWHYLNAHDQWVQGSGNVFVVSHRTVGGPTQDKKDLTFLEWNKKLDSRYAGLLIKVSLYCKDSHSIGCLLAKINGTYSYDRTSPPLTTSANAPTTTTQPPSTSHSSTTTVTIPASKPINPDSVQRTPAFTDEAAAITTPAANKNQAQREATTAAQQKYFEQTSTPYGVIAGIVAAICLGCVLFVAYRRRKTCSSWMSKRNDRAVIVEETYQDPIYDFVRDGPDFDNPVYCDPAADNVNRRSAQDPLPPVPGRESSYQPLSDLTRTSVHEPTTPPLPPISYPAGPDNESYEYAKPLKQTGDYDNPPVIDNPPENESSSYDNPPTSNNLLANESSDFDPPQTNNSTDFSLQESSDYDNPPQTALPKDYTPPIVNIVPETSPFQDDQQESGPEYFVLEPEETSM